MPFLNLMRNRLKPKAVNDALTNVVQKSPPDFSSVDAGKILSVDDDGELEWRDEENQLPSVETTDEGKVLTVNSLGEWVPEELPSTDTYDLDYSTTEKNTGIKWIDGSPIYSKVVYTPTLNSGDNVVTHGISNLGTVISAKSTAIRGTGDSAKQMTIPYAPSDDLAWALGLYEFSATNFSIKVGSNYASTFSLTECYTIIEYTKATTTVKKKNKSQSLVN